MTRSDDADTPVDLRPQSTEPTAVQAAREANERDDLPDADTDTKQSERGSKSSPSK